jgi:biotin carboxyl carrier protein
MRKFIITIEGKNYEVGVEEVGGTASNTMPVVSEIKAAPVTPKAEAPKASTAVTSGTELEAPMPGLILELKVAEGAKVKAGDIVLVLEAMKMANDISAPCDGTISFKVQKGANVDTGAVLAIIG